MIVQGTLYIDLETLISNETFDFEIDRGEEISDLELVQSNETADLEIENVIETVDLEIGKSKEAYDFDLELKYIQQMIGGDMFDGPYIVDPKFIRQTLPTANKVLTDDVKVNAIQVSSVTNLSGGKTVYIGGIYNA